MLHSGYFLLALGLFPYLKPLLWSPVGDTGDVLSHSTVSCKAQGGVSSCCTLVFCFCFCTFSLARSIVWRMFVNLLKLEETLVSWVPGACCSWVTSMLFPFLVTSSSCIMSTCHLLWEVHLSPSGWKHFFLWFSFNSVNSSLFCHRLLMCQSPLLGDLCPLPLLLAQGLGRADA